MKIAFTINKGGVGKTASLCTITQILALGGYKCLIADMDPQANTSRMFGIKEDIEGLNYGQLLCKRMQEEELKVFVCPSNFENIDIIPSSVQLFGMNDFIYDEMKQDSSTGLMFRRNMEVLESGYDFILMDSTPSFDHICESVIAASDMLLIPSNLNNFSYEGINRLIELMLAINDRYNLNVKFGGTFFTRVNNRTNLFKDLTKSYGELFGEFFIPVAIRECNKVDEAHTLYTPLYNFAPRCTAFVDYVELVGRIGIMDKKHYYNFKAKIQAKKQGGSRNGDKKGNI